MSIPFVDMAAMHANVRGELDAVWRASLESNRFIGGPFVEQFESAWAEYCQTRYCVGLSSGTAALELTFKAIGIGAGDKVIVPANTFIAGATAVVAVGAKPVFADVDPETLLLTAEAVHAALSPRTAAILPVHLYGQPANMDAINAVAEFGGHLRYRRCSAGAWRLLERSPSRQHVVSWLLQLLSWQKSWCIR